MTPEEYADSIDLDHIMNMTRDDWLQELWWNGPFDPGMEPSVEQTLFQLALIKRMTDEQISRRFSQLDVSLHEPSNKKQWIKFLNKRLQYCITCKLNGEHHHLNYDAN